MAGLMACLTQLAAECGPSHNPAYFGFLRVGGKPAVYVPMCKGDGLADIAVSGVYEGAEGEESRLVWAAKRPRTSPSAQGLVVLGDGEAFEEVPRPSTSSPFPTYVDVKVHTTGGRSLDNRGKFSDAVPDHPVGTPLEQMTFDVQPDVVTHNRRDFSQLRKEFLGKLRDCLLPSP
jgi:hypothetical protein